MQPLIPKENTVLQRWTQRLGRYTGTLYVAAATATEITREIKIWAQGWKRTWMEVVPHSVVHHTEVSMCFGFEVHTCCPLALHDSSNHMRNEVNAEKIQSTKTSSCFAFSSDEADLRTDMSSLSDRKSYLAAPAPRCWAVQQLPW